MEMEKLESTSMNLEENNIEKLKELFPNCVTEGKINFDILRELLGDEVDNNREKYQFTWNGKAKAIKIAQSPSSATLRPCKEKSKDWDTTQNLYIEGDNLEVLKQLQKTYFGKIKMIYIDPPYNTGHDFVYKDDFKNSIESYKEQTSQTTKSNPETSGRYHTDWLNMMYPRLVLARNLLTDDGIIFISIDDGEVDNLRKLLNEIYGENNFVNQVIWVRNSSGKTVSKQLTQNIEYLLIYSKSNNYQLNPVFKPLSESTIKMYSKDDHDGRGKYRLYPLQKPAAPGPETTYDYIDNNGKVWKCPPKGWRMKESKLKALENDGRLCMENGTLSEKAYWNERASEGRLADTYWDDMPENSVGTKEFSSLFNNKALFSNPKPTDYLIRMIKAQTSAEGKDIVLDFFSGSASTAHAIFKQNTSDLGNRINIMVQLPELIDENSEAFNYGYKNICDLGEERIRRAGEQIKSEWLKEHKGEGLFADENVEFPVDIGFKVFKLDSTNIKPWDNTTVMDEDALGLYDKVFKEDRSKEDILYEIMLKYGVFDMKGSEVTINNKKMFKVGSRFMLVCLEDNITSEDIKAICNEKPRVVVFKEEGFADDNDKINAVYNLEKAGIEEVKCI